MRARLAPVILAWALLGAGPVAAQQPAARLESFVAHVGRLWVAEDASGLADLAPADGRMVIEVGDEAQGMAQSRHAAAALRALFASRRSVNVHTGRAAISGGTPPLGFGELFWVSRPKGTTVPQSSTLYIGMVWEGGEWRIREIRVRD